MHQIAILDDYQHSALGSADWSSLAGRCEVTVFDRHIADPAVLAQALQPFDIVCLMRERTGFPASLLRSLPRLKLLVFSGLMHRGLDLPTALERGVTVCHTHSGDTQHATSELTWALILAAARHVALEDRRLREGRWQTTLGGTLHGKTLGLLGLGRVGTAVARLGAAFGMKVIAWSPNLTPARAAEAGVEAVTKDALFSRSDVLSVHLVLAPATRGIAGAHELALMKPQALLVNTARGGLVDEIALVEALRSGRLGGAALDVFEQEPLPTDHPLLAIDNVVLAPHVGYVTRETYQIFYRDMVENIEAFLAGAPIRVVGGGA